MVPLQLKANEFKGNASITDSPRTVIDFRPIRGDNFNNFMIFFPQQT